MYLASINQPNSAATLRQDLNVSDSFDDAISKKYEGLLEKKWTSVVRLQKKVSHHNIGYLERQRLISQR